MNFLVETKNEYTIQLVNIISPHIYDGFESIYNESKKIIKKGEEKKVLKAFQQFIKRIPQWNTNLIETETKRIESSSRCDFLNNLLKAVIKANIILLTNTNNLRDSNVDQQFLDIPLSKFIHKCYIECARQFYTSPYFFYHECKPIEKKRNQKDCYDLIKSCIKEAIRKLLPVQHILDKYLGNEILTGNQEIDKPISNIDSENLRKMVNRELESKLNEHRPQVSTLSNNIENDECKVLSQEKFLNYENSLNDMLSVNNFTKPQGNETKDISLNSQIEKGMNLKMSEDNKQNFSSLNDNVKRSEDNRQNLFSLSNNIKMDETDTMKLLSDLRKNIESEDLKSLPITNYYSENKEEINKEMKDSEMRQSIAQELKDVNKNNLEYQGYRNNIEVLKNENIDTESSIPYIRKDDEYEDVFSNLNDSVSSDILTEGSKKANKKDINFKSFNSFNMV